MGRRTRSERPLPVELALKGHEQDLFALTPDQDRMASRTLTPLPAPPKPKAPASRTRLTPAASMKPAPKPVPKPAAPAPKPKTGAAERVDDWM